MTDDDKAKMNISFAVKKFWNKDIFMGLEKGEISVITSGRASGKSNSQSKMVEYLNQQIKQVNEYRALGYTSIYMEDSKSRKEMIAWCNNNCNANFYVAGQLFMFEDEKDAISFAFVW